MHMTHSMLNNKRKVRFKIHIVKCITQLRKSSSSLIQWEIHFNFCIRLNPDLGLSESEFTHAVQFNKHKCSHCPHVLWVSDVHGKNVLQHWIITK